MSIILRQMKMTLRKFIEKQIVSEFGKEKLTVEGMLDYLEALEYRLTRICQSLKICKRCGVTLNVSDKYTVCSACFGYHVGLTTETNLYPLSSAEAKDLLSIEKGDE